MAYRSETQTIGLRRNLPGNSDPRPRDGHVLCVDRPFTAFTQRKNIRLMMVYSENEDFSRGLFRKIQEARRFYEQKCTKPEVEIRDDGMS